MLPVVADTIHAARAAEGTVSINIALISMGIAMAGCIITVSTVLYRMGQQNGRQEQKNVYFEDQLKSLDDASRRAITREELDNRFEMMSGQLQGVKDRFDDLIGLLRTIVPKVGA